MSDLLVDSSVWIDHLRDRSPAASDRLTAALAHGTDSSVRMCEPIAMELIAGASLQQLPTIQALVDGVQSLTFDSALDFRVAGGIYRDVRASGVTVRSMTDCLIAAVALRHGATLVHRDRDFDAIAKVTPLHVERWG